MLADNKKINNSITQASTKTIKAFHRLLFEDLFQDAPRTNRRRIREFNGFKFTFGDAAYENKLKFCIENFTNGDLIAVGTTLALPYDDDKEIMSRKILRRLMKLTAQPVNEHDDTDEDDEDDDDNDDDDDGKDDDEDDDDDDEDEANDDNDNDGDEHYDDKEDTKKKIKSERIKRSTEPAGNNSSGSHKTLSPPQFIMSYKDVEESIRKFSGDDNYPVESFFEDLDDEASLYNWDDVTRFIILKKSLTGSAQTVVRSERGVRSYDKLKKLLIKEFGRKVNSAQLHKMLANRRLKQNEKIKEYFFAMKELAALGHIEDASLIHYIIEGIPDNPFNKSLLYEAENLSQLKHKLEIYDKMRARVRPSLPEKRITSEKPDNPFPSPTNTSETVSRCYNCGNKGHKATECSYKSKGFKCFNCNNFGHKSAICPLKTKEVTNQNPVNTIDTKKTAKNIKPISLLGKTFPALIDTGCDVTLLAFYAYEIIGQPLLQPTDLTLQGFGCKNQRVSPLGQFTNRITIDEDDYITKIYVVPDDSMSHSIIIGNDLLNHSEVIINQEGIKIKKVDPIQQMMNIQVENVYDPIDRVEDKIKQITDEYKPEKIQTVDVEMKIVLTDNQPIYSKPRRLPIPEREFVELQISEWLKDNTIEPCYSDYTSPVVVTKKKDGSYRLCIDYRRINKVMVKDRYPLPVIDDLLDSLQGAQYFSCLDLKNGFFHVAVERHSRKYTSFVVHNGQYQFKKMPFGMCNSPSVFQRYVNCCFRELINERKLSIYMDDIIVPGRDEHEAMERLLEVLKVASNFGLQLNIKKCQFMKKKIEFLGHVVEDGKIHPSPSKVLAVQNFKEPTTVKELQRFLGLAGYFRKFIENYSRLARPLTDLLKKDKIYEFNKEQNIAFLTLKNALIQEPVLRIYDRKLETEVHTDASIDGYGAILLQRCPTDEAMHPVYFMSRRTTPAERNYTSYELEVRAIVEALKKFRIYLLGIKFKIVTDCSAFQKTMMKKDLVTRVARWALLIEEFDCEVIHRTGNLMKHVDALSRHPVMTIETHFPMYYKIKKEQDLDGEIKAIKELLKHHQDYENYLLKKDVLFKLCDGRELLVVPKTLQHDLIKRAHENGHYALRVVMEKIQQEYFIQQLSSKIMKVIENCVHCILMNKKRGKKEGLLHPIPKGDIPLNTYHIDHLGPLSTTNKNYNHVFAVVDAFTKFVWLYATKSTTAKEVISKLELQKKFFGSPQRIISDRGTAFTSKEFADYCLQEDIKHHLITTGLPRANGQVERLNSLINTILSKLSIDDPGKWYKHIDRLQIIINSAPNRSTGKTPFELMFGVKMKCKDDEQFKHLLEEELLELFDEERNELRIAAKNKIVEIQEQTKRHYDKKRKPPDRYRVGDLVAIRRTQMVPGLKLRPKYLGPYKISKCKENGTYDVRKIGSHDGPHMTTTCDEYIKPWVPHADDGWSSGPDDPQDGRIVERVQERREESADK